MYYTITQVGMVFITSAANFHYISGQMSLRDLCDAGITKAHHYRADGKLLTKFDRSDMSITFY